MSDKQWPSNVQTRTAEEWTALAQPSEWANPENRAIVMEALRALQVPASEYVRAQPAQRVERIIELQEQMKPGSTKGAKEPAKTKAAAATTKKASATTKAAAPAATAPAASESQGGGGSVDISPVLAALETLSGEIADLNAKHEELARKSTQIFVALRILVLSNPEAAALLDDTGTVRELASGNLSSVFDEGNEG
jgi:hypothetical protein